MKICNFRLPGEELDMLRLGLVRGDEVLEAPSTFSYPKLFAIGEGAIDLFRSGGASLKVSKVVLGPPVRRPGKIVAAIVNTRGMLGGADLSLERPRLDMKAPSTVIGPGEPIQVPEFGIRPEVELAAIIGRRISGASITEARSAIFGYTVLNDVTAPRDSKNDAYEAYRRDKTTGEIRKTLMRGPLFRSKNHDTFCPMGPVLVSAGEVGDNGHLRMTTEYGGSVLQEGSTSEYIFSPEELASYVSRFLTLEPGDVVSCGSVGWTAKAIGDRDPTEFVLPDKVGSLRLEIERIGVLENPLSPPWT